LNLGTIEFQSFQLPVEVLEQIFLFATTSSREQKSYEILASISQVSKGWYLTSYGKLFQVIRKTFPKTKPILDPNNPKHQEKIENLEKLVEEVREKSSEYCHSGNTCTLEALHAVRSKLGDKNQYRPKLWMMQSLLVCLYRNWGKEKTWQKLASRLNLSISTDKLSWWHRKVASEEERKNKRKTLEFQREELAKKRMKIQRRAEETKKSASIYQYSKASSLEDSSGKKKEKTCGCTTGCSNKRCGCMKINESCSGCKCQNCKNPFNKSN